MTTTSRRELLRLLGAGAAVGIAGAGTVGAARPERYIVGASSPDAVRAARRRAASVRRLVDLGPHGVAVAGRFSPAAVAALSRRRDVRYVERDGTVRAVHHREGHGGGPGGDDGGDGGDGGSSQTLPWGVDRVDAEAAHAGGATGAGAHVAVLDTGIDSDHPDLQARLGTGRAFVECRGNPRSCATRWDDDNGHGTHCAGTVAATDNDAGVVGVAPGATLHAVKVLDKHGSGSYSDVAAGIEWVAEQGYDVASMSLGGGYSETLELVCANAAAAGVLLVAAAGNDGGAVSYPAAYDSVVAVSATDATDALASFSNRGPAVELAAPGVDVDSTYLGGGYRTLSGTSMACPHVSGAAALVMADGTSASDARTRLASTATDLAPGGEDDWFGHGLVDAEQAAIGTTTGDD